MLGNCQTGIRAYPRVLLSISTKLYALSGPGVARLIEQFCARGDRELVEKYYAIMVEKRWDRDSLRTYNAMLGFLSSEDDPAAYDALLERMIRLGIEAGPDTFEAMASGFRRKGDLRAVRGLYSLQQEKGVTPTTGFLDEVLQVRGPGRGRLWPVRVSLWKSANFLACADSAELIRVWSRGAHLISAGLTRLIHAACTLFYPVSLGTHRPSKWPGSTTNFGPGCPSTNTTAARGL